MRYFAGGCVLLLALGLGLLSAAQAQDIPDVGDAELEQALVLAGDNRAQLEEALFFCIQKPYTMAAMRFLIVSLPLADLGCITGDELIEHVDLAMQARHEMPYGMHYDDATWAHFVLPPRVSQEPLSGWRPYFWNELRELAAGCQTLQEAAVAVNKWCAQRARYAPTQRRDQGPLVTLKSGTGRCEECMIVFVDALRSVGIPARNAYCPYWTWSDDNHAWTEIYGSDARWHFTESCSTKDTLDVAWYSQAAKRAPLVVSLCFGLPAELGPDVLSYSDEVGARYCKLNSTGAYRRTAWLRLEIPEAAGAADPRHFTVSVFNYGALRPIAQVRLAEDGSGEIELGPGDYIVTTDAFPDARAACVTLEFDTATTIGLEAAGGLPQSVILTYPQDP